MQNDETIFMNMHIIRNVDDLNKFSKHLQF
jgi:hypothetical protein